jgi:hypothetical protein
VLIATFAFAYGESRACGILIKALIAWRLPIVRSSYGFPSKGMQIFSPLDPRKVIVLCDNRAYRIGSDGKEIIEIVNRRGVYAYPAPDTQQSPEPRVLIRLTAQDLLLNLAYFPRFRIYRNIDQPCRCTLFN